MEPKQVKSFRISHAIRSDAEQWLARWENFHHTDVSLTDIVEAGLVLFLEIKDEALRLDAIAKAKSYGLRRAMEEEFNRLGVPEARVPASDAAATVARGADQVRSGAKRKARKEKAS